ncbi:attachment protein, partial [Pseudomonas aeruginosa]
TAPGSFSSPDAACQAGLEIYKKQYPAVTFEIKDRFPVSTEGFRCNVWRYYNGNRIDPDWTISVQRKGDSCPSGFIYNIQTGRCDEPPPPDPCRDKAGQPASFTLMRPDLGGLGSVENVCMNGCQVAIGSATCGPLNSDPTKGFCSGTGTYTGAQCSPTDEMGGGNNPDPDPNPDPPDQPDPPDKPDENGCIPPAQWSGTTCVMPPKEPGDGDGGDGGSDGGSGGGNNNGGGDGSGGGDGTGG